MNRKRNTKQTQPAAFVRVPRDIWERIARATHFSKPERFDAIASIVESNSELIEKLASIVNTPDVVRAVEKLAINDVTKWLRVLLRQYRNSHADAQIIIRDHRGDLTIDLAIASIALDREDYTRPFGPFGPPLITRTRGEKPQPIILSTRTLSGDALAGLLRAMCESAERQATIGD